jgi:hypothetical protein
MGRNVILAAAGILIGVAGADLYRNRHAAGPVVAPPILPAVDKTMQVQRLEIIDSTGKAVMTLYVDGGKPYAQVWDGSAVRVLDMGRMARLLK